MQYQGHMQPFDTKQRVNFLRLYLRLGEDLRTCFRGDSRLELASDTVRPSHTNTFDSSVAAESFFTRTIQTTRRPLAYLAQTTALRCKYSCQVVYGMHTSIYTLKK